MTSRDKDIRLEQIISSVDNGQPACDLEFLHDLRSRSAREFDLATGDRADRAHNETPWGRIMNNKTLKFSTAAAVIVCGAFLWAILFGPSNNPNAVAWADVTAPILEAKAASYDLIIGDEGNAPVIHDVVMGSRIRRIVEGIDSVSIIDLDTSMCLTLEPSEKSAVYIKLEGLPSGAGNQLARLQELIITLSDDPSFIVEELGHRNIAGESLVGFAARHPESDITIWADPLTGSPKRIEVTSGQLAYICRNFRFDIEPDETLFSMNLPDGYTRDEVKLDLMGSTEEDFVESLRIQAELFDERVFPDDVSIAHVVSQAPVLQKAFAVMDATDEEKTELGMKLNRGILFIRFFKGEGPWHYAGKGVKLGDSETAIFSYRPQGSETYRVIYGDLSVRDASADHLPEPPTEPEVKNLCVQTWDRSTFIGRQEDNWHIVAGDQIEATSTITLTRMPEGATTMPITLPYRQAELASVALGRIDVAFNPNDQGGYDIPLPTKHMSNGQATFLLTWAMPLTTLSPRGNDYNTVLASCIPVTSYELHVSLADHCGYVYSRDPAQRTFRPFYMDKARGKSSFGTCNLCLDRPND